MSTFIPVALILVILVSLFGCSNDDLSTPEETFGTIEINMPTDEIGASWHLYGPGDSFRHGDTEVVLQEMPAGQYTIIWTAVKNWTAPPPSRHALLANRTLVLHGDYLDKAPADKFVLLSTGQFVMGSENGTRFTISEGDTTRILAEIGRDLDEVRHHVELTNGFYLGKTEITNQEFVEMGNWAIGEGHATTTETAMLDAMDGSTVELINFDFPGTPIQVHEDGTLRLVKDEDAARPVIELTWYGAASYCDWLSLEEGLDKAYDHSDWTVGGGDFYLAEGYRLPTEAEWEYACRAGTESAFWSGEIETGSCNEPALNGAGWFCGSEVKSSQDVSTKSANPWGIFDTHGNVWEWCNDLYGYYDVDEGYAANPDTVIFLLDPIGPEEGDFRAIRGGRWLLASSLCRSAARMMADPDFKGINIGFRVAQTDIP